VSDARSSHLLRQIPTLASLDEATGFREQLSAQGEMTGEVMVRLKERMDYLRRRDGK
jgi:hypothetical protein